MSARPQHRRRASSVTDALKCAVPSDPKHSQLTPRQVPLNRSHASGSVCIYTKALFPTLIISQLTPVGAAPEGASSLEVKPLPAGPPRRKKSELPEQYQSKGFLGDLKTGRWMLVPGE